MNTNTLRLIVVLGGWTVLQGCGGGQEVAPPAPSGEQPPLRARDAAEPRQEPKAIQAAEPVGEAPFNLAYLDQDTELFLFARPAAILESPFVQALTGDQLSAIEAMREEIGIGFDQIDTVTVGVRELQQLSEQSRQQFAQMQGAASLNRGNGAPPSVNGTENTVVVVRTTEPVSVDDLTLSHGEGDAVAERTHRSKTYYPLPGAAGENGYLYAVDETTLIVAGEDAIKKIIDQGDKPALPPVNLSFIPAATDVIVAVVPQDREALFQGFPASGLGTPAASIDPLSLDPMEDALLLGNGDRDDDDDDDDGRRFRGPSAGRRATPAAQTPADQPSIAQVKAGAISVSFETDLRVDVLVHCDTAQAADGIHTAAKEAVRSATQAFAAAQHMLPGVLQQIGRAVLDTVTSQAEGSVVTISATLPESQQANLAVVPMAIMGMMMTGSVDASDIGPLVDWQERAREVIERGQPPVSAEGLPSGVELRALSRWGIAPLGDPHAAAPLEVAIVATGPPAAEAVAYGPLELTELDAGEGARLKWLGATRTSEIENPARDVVRVDRDALFPRHPAEGVATGYTFSLSGDAPAALPVIAGQMTLKVAAHVRDVMIQSVAAAMQSIGDETLREAEFSVRTSTEGGLPALVFTYKDTQAIRAIDVLGADGQPLGRADGNTSAVTGQVRHIVPLPPNADTQSLRLRVSVFEDLQDVPIAFRFEGLALPEPQSLTPQQQALQTWTPCTLVSELPEGLMAEAQARWPAAQSASNAGSLPFAFGGSGARSDPRQAASANAGAAAGLPDDYLLGTGDDDRSRGFGGRRRDDDDDEPVSGFRSRRDAARGQGAYESEFDADLLGTGLPTSSSTLSTADMNDMLQLAVDLTGPLAETVIAVGELAVERAVSEMGTDLSFEAGVYDWRKVSEGWIDIDPEAVPTQDQPPNGLRVLFLFAPPDAPIERIKQFTGTMQIRAAREQIEAVVRNLNNRTNRRIKDRTLGKFGIEIVVAVEENVLMYRQLEGDETRIADMFPVDHNGVRIEDVTHTTAVENENLIHYFNFASTVPPRVGMKFFVNLGVQELEVPLRFHNVPVAPPPDTPAAR